MFSKLFRKSPEKAPAENCGLRHIAFIMDGNGRWAKNRGLPRLAGHNAGMRVCAVFDEYSVYIDEEKHRKADYYINDFNEVIKELRKAEI